MLKVYKVADVVNGIMTFSDAFPFKGEVLGILTAFDSVANPKPDSTWRLEVTIDKYTRFPRVWSFPLPALISASDSLQQPLFLPDRQLIFFCSELFIAESPARNPEECNQVIAEVKKRITGETSEPTDNMLRPPHIPRGHVRLWIDQAIAAELAKRYAGTDAIVATADEWDDLKKRYAIGDPFDLVSHWTTLARKPNHPVSAEGILYELDKLTGLAVVKREVRSLINYLRIQNLRREEGLPTGQMTMHLVFTGNPGTGKTTVARLLARLYKAMGFLPEGHLVETDRAGLVGEYLGHTAPKTLQVIQKAIGGVLFIDEAYALARTDHGQRDTFGLEAIDTLLKAMEDNRDKLVVIVAGYPNEMKHFISSNPGLRSRFTRYIDFPDYTPNELTQIFEQDAADSGYLLSDGARRRAAELFKDAHANRGEGFGNGRWVRTIFERACLNLSDRIASDSHITRAELMTLQESDIEDISGK